jgi:hypothetical protein
MFSDVLSGSTSGAGSSSSWLAAVTLPLGHHHEQGIRRTRVADRHRHRAGLGRLHGQPLIGTILKRREKHMYVAIWFYIATFITVAVLHIVNSLAMPASALQELLDLRRRAGRAGAVVVRAQRRGVLPDHAVPRPDVLLPAEGGQPPGLLLPAVDHPFLGADLHLHLGRSAPPALQRAARLGAVARHGVLDHAHRSLLGRHAQRPADAARRVGQGAPGSRC